MESEVAERLWDKAAFSAVIQYCITLLRMGFVIDIDFLTIMKVNKVLAPGHKSLFLFYVTSCCFFLI